MLTQCFIFTFKVTREVKKEMSKKQMQAFNVGALKSFTGDEKKKSDIEGGRNPRIWGVVGT